MDKTARLQYAFGMPTGKISPDDAPLNALVVGVMSAVAAELNNSEVEKATAALADFTRKTPAPHPHLTPGQVLEIQLSALKVNNYPTSNHGIQVAFNFCTPESRDYLGSAEKLTPLFNKANYRPLLNFQTVTFQALTIKADRASQRFSVIAGDGAKADYVGQLILQSSGPETGCWLTDAIFRVTDQ